MKSAFSNIAVIFRINLFIFTLFNFSINITAQSSEFDKSIMISRSDGVHAEYRTTGVSFRRSDGGTQTLISGGSSTMQFINFGTPSASNLSTATIATTDIDDELGIRLRIDGLGNIQIGQNNGSNIKAPVQLSHKVNDSDGRGSGVAISNFSGDYFSMYVSSNGNLFLYSDYSEAYIGRFNRVNGSYTSVSDERLKNNLQPLPDLIQKVTHLNPISYNYTYQIDQSERFIGLMAQELMVQFPELVSYDDGIGTYSIDYASLSVVALKCIQEQQVQIERLESAIRSLNSN